MPATSTLALSDHSFTLSVWLNFSPAFSALSQTLFRAAGDSFTISSLPASNEVRVALGSSAPFSASSFSIPPSVWNLVSVSALASGQGFSRISIVVDNTHASGSVPNTFPAITSFVLGESFYGVMRDFRLYDGFISYGFFNFVSNCKSLLLIQMTLSVLILSSTTIHPQPAKVIQHSSPSLRSSLYLMH